jgi:hypothetical protein
MDTEQCFMVRGALDRGVCPGIRKQAERHEGRAGDGICTTVVDADAVDPI